MMFAPLEAWRRVKVTDRRATVDYAHAVKDLSDTHFPDADKIVLMQDTLSTHTTASLYEAFPAAETRRLVERVRMALHAQARKLARHGRIRTRCTLNPVPGSPYSRQAKTDQGSRRLAATPKQTSRQSRLAIHSRAPPRQLKGLYPQFD